MKKQCCPFCGSTAVDAYEVDRDLWSVICDACRAIGPVADGEKQALIRWNARDQGQVPVRVRHIW